MARIETDPNYTAPTFSRATAGTDLFKKEDVQALAAAVSTHDHTTGKGAALVAGSIPAGSITSGMIADATIDTADLKDGAVTSAKIADGTIATADLADQSVTNAKLASDTARANLLTNGSFDVWQRGNGPFNLGSYNADRWQITGNPGDTISLSRDTTNVDSGSLACAAVTFTKGSGLTGLTQNDSGWQLAGRVVSFSIRVRTATANAVKAGLHNGTGWTYGSLHPGGGVYQTLSVAGLTVTGTVHVGVWFDASCTAYIDNAMLAVGSVAADYAPLHPADDLARCQRYYEVLNAGGIVYGVGQAFSATQATVSMSFRSQKATTPTINFVAPANYFMYTAAAGAQAVTSIGASATSIYGVDVRPVTASGLVAGNATGFNGVGSGLITVEANP